MKPAQSRTPSPVHDHFGNFSEAQDGVNTVETMMVDNAYALGLVLEKVAHSKYGKDTLIFRN